MIIDFHTHVFSPRMKENRSKYITSDPCFATLYSGKNTKLATADELIASMDNAGVDISVITNIGWTTQELCNETNDYILESIARYPRRLIGFCTVQPGLCLCLRLAFPRCFPPASQLSDASLDDLYSQFLLDNARRVGIGNL